MELNEYSKFTEEELYKHIGRLKEEKNAVILVHNYQMLEVQKIADHLGDSLGLSRKAAETDASIILFCGVKFMAETAKILSPSKTVLLPDPTAGCGLANFATADEVRSFRKKHPDYKIVTYVNSSAEVKAESDICCTSSNAVEVVKSLGNAKILFLPDKNLGHYVRKVTGADITLWEGYCYVHNFITIDDVKKAREMYPGAKLIVHPECPPPVVDAADEVGSTSFMYRYARDHEEELIIGTEIGLIERINYEFPNKKVYPLTQQAICRTMKYTTLEKTAWALEEEKWKVEISPDIRERAYNSIKKMIEIG
ncbi:quinolinate synthase NadA [bacterium]|nr:quinolinate synthase NadA [bacterium]